MSGVDLVQWLGAQLDEDQWYAEEAATHAAATGTFIGKGTRWHAQDYDRLWAMGDDESKPDRKLAECGHGGFRLASYLARHDPARVLREIDAKRQLLALHVATPGWVGADDDNTLACQVCGDLTVKFPCRTLRLLALPYADRDGYQETWRL